MGEKSAADSGQGADLRRRVITACVLLPLTVLASLAGGEVFLIITLPVMCVGMLEFFVMEKETRMQGSSLTGIPTGVGIALGFFLGVDALWQGALVAGIALTLLLEISRQPKQLMLALAQVGTTLCGIVYIAFPAAFMLSLRNTPPDGAIWLFVVYAITWGTDSFAYAAGHAFGRTRLAPKISPNKTVEGAVGGVIGGWLMAFGLLHFTGALQPSVIPMLLAGPFLAVGGDLFESAMKRFFRVKDSYVEGLNLMPGHGGVLDRIDALVWVATWVFGYLLLAGIV